MLQQADTEILTPTELRVLVALNAQRRPGNLTARNRQLYTTRGALYKDIYVARRKLRAHLTEMGPCAECVGDGARR